MVFFIGPVHLLFLLSLFSTLKAFSWLKKNNWSSPPSSSCSFFHVEDLSRFAFLLTFLAVTLFLARASVRTRHLSSPLDLPLRGPLSAPVPPYILLLPLRVPPSIEAPPHALWLFAAVFSRQLPPCFFFDFQPSPPFPCALSTPPFSVPSNEGSHSVL